MLNQWRRFWLTYDELKNIIYIQIYTEKGFKMSERIKQLNLKSYQYRVRNQNGMRLCRLNGAIALKKIL